MTDSINNNPTNVLITFVGPSASGKTVLSRFFVERGFKELVSTTTRPMRNKEKNGYDYYFISKESFIEKIEQNLFIETNLYNGNYYGITKSELQNSLNDGSDVVLVTEQVGLNNLINHCKENNILHYSVFVNNEPSLLLGRLLNRYLKEVSNYNFDDNVIVEKYKEYIDPLYNILKTSDIKTNGGQFYASDDVLEKLKNILVKFTNDFTDKFDQDTLNSTLKRLLMFEFEQSNWVKTAIEGSNLYNYVTETFTKENEDQIINEIINEVNNLKLKKNCSKKLSI